MIKRKTSVDIQNMKGGKLVCLTAYTAPFASILDKYADILLVGDSVGMVLYGMDSTLPVTLDIMCNHGKAVVKASEQSCVVVDLPFGSYQESEQQAFCNAAHIMQETGCNAVKLEGGIEMSATVKFLTERGIPVMGHTGLTPQSVNTLGGYKYRGQSPTDRTKILADSIAIAESGAFSIALEGIIEDLAAEITSKINIPTIGIGASPKCDGQILVSEDMAGLTERIPKFVKKYGNLAEILDKAVSSYAQEVQSGEFPSEEYCYKKNN